jgi:hypothetical protein
MMDKRLKEIQRRYEAATPGPWAWEDYGEKDNNFHIGVALDKQDKQLTGRVQTERYDEDADVFVEDVLWRESIGDMEIRRLREDNERAEKVVIEQLRIYARLSAGNAKLRRVLEKTRGIAEGHSDTLAEALHELELAESLLEEKK